MTWRKRYRVEVIVTVAFFTGIFTHALHAKDDAADEKMPTVSVSSSQFVLPDISATHVNWHEPSGQEIMSSAIELSPKGLRVRELGAAAFNEMLQDFIGERGWFIDHDRSVSHHLQLVEMPEMGSASPGAAGSFLGPKPCGLLLTDDQGPGRWRGRQVRAFHCTDDEGNVLAVEFLDDIYQIIVYRRTADGYVDELSSMTDRTFSDTHFTPPSDYRAVEKQEFFFGAPALKSYTPSAD